MEYLQQDNLLSVESLDGIRTPYTVQALTVVDSRHTNLAHHEDVEALILTTCFPFNALVPGGPLRYVVRADKLSGVSIESGDEK